MKTLSEVDAVLPLEVVVQYPLSELPLFSTRGSLKFHMCGFEGLKSHMKTLSEVDVVLPLDVVVQ